jgi:hypothetical protein
VQADTSVPLLVDVIKHHVKLAVYPIRQIPIQDLDKKGEDGEDAGAQVMLVYAIVWQKAADPS